MIIILTPLSHFSDHEPDLVAISRKYPVPNFPISREILLVAEVIEHGPRVKMVHQTSLPANKAQQGERIANMIANVANVDSKPAALPIPDRGVDIDSRPRNPHPSVTGYNPLASATIHTRNSFITQSNEFKDAIANATDNMIRIGMIHRYQDREMCIKFGREVKACLVFTQLLNYHRGGLDSVQAHSMNLTQKNVDNMIMNYFFH